MNTRAALLVVTAATALAVPGRALPAPNGPYRFGDCNDTPDRADFIASQRDRFQLREAGEPEL